jgi:ABC-2 type transport system ATP-binding protein
MGTSELIDVQGLRIRRGRFALEVPSWRVGSGEVVGLVGPNGAGKTTLLEAVAGLRSVDGGTVRVFGLDPWDDPVTVRSALGFMSDDMALFELRIDRLLHMLSGYYPSWDARLVESLVKRFEIDLRSKVGELSRGQGSRLRLVTAMAFRPRVLLLDEPAAGLDLSGRRSLLESVLEVVRDEDRSVVVPNGREDLSRQGMAAGICRPPSAIDLLADRRPTHGRGPRVADHDGQDHGRLREGLSLWSIHGSYLTSGKPSSPVPVNDTVLPRPVADETVTRHHVPLTFLPSKPAVREQDKGESRQRDLSIWVISPSCPIRASVLLSAATPGRMPACRKRPPISGRAPSCTSISTRSTRPSRCSTSPN